MHMLTYKHHGHQKTNKNRMEEVLFIITNIIIKSAVMLYPVIPNSSKKF